MHPRSSIEVWTDGSFQPSTLSGGTGYVLNHKSDNTQFCGGNSICFTTSSYDSEAAAFLEGIESLLELRPNNEVIAIYSDCHGLLTQLQALTLKPKLVDSIISKIIRILCDLIELENSLFLTWVPGHIGIEGNEQADTLAKASIENPRNELDTQRAPRLANFKYFMRQHLEQSMDEYLQTAVKPSSQKSYPERSFFKGKQITINNKTQIVYPYKTEKFEPTLFRARTGHTYTRDHLFRFGIVKERTCRHCNHPVETVEHLALHCMILGEHEDIQASRILYQSEVPSHLKFNDALWSHPSVCQHLLRSLRRHTQNL